MPALDVRYSDVIGQTEIATRLKEYSTFYKAAGSTPGHILLIGGDGMGKSWIARAFANERGVAFKLSEGSEIAIVGDLTAQVTNLRVNEVFFISHINALRKIHLKPLQNWMREGKYPVSIGQGPAARTYVMEVGPSTLIATCPRKSDCPLELIEEFSLVLELQPYSVSELVSIAKRIASEQNLTLSPDAAHLLVRHCERKPRSVNGMLSRLVKAINRPSISEEDVRQFFAMMGMRLSFGRSSAISDDFAELSGVDFERMVLGLLGHMGFRAEMTKTSGDGGIDIVAILDKPIIGGRYLFQCKRYAPDNLVGVSAVRDFYGAVTADRAVKGVFISTSDFIPQARDFAEKSGVELVDMAQLKGLVFESKRCDAPGDLESQGESHGTGAGS